MNLLGWPDWEITGVEEKAKCLCISCFSPPRQVSCLHCGPDKLVSKLHVHGSKDQEFKDAPIRGSCVRLIVRRIRYKCQECGKTFLQPLPEMDEDRRMTLRLVQFVEERSLGETFAAVGREVGMDPKTAASIFEGYAKRMDATTEFITPDRMGIDEVNLMGKARGVFTNLDRATVIGMLENNKQPAMTKFMHEMPDRNLVKVVTIDMCEPYRLAVRKCLPKAALVVDKWHVLRAADKALDEVRKSLVDNQSDNQRKRMKRSRFLLKKRAARMKPEERATLVDWLSNYPRLKEAYEAKERFYEFFEGTSCRKSAGPAIDDWDASLEGQVRKDFGKLVKCLEKWREEILAYFDTRATNALTESLNRVAGKIEEDGRGYSFEVMRAKMLYRKAAHARDDIGDCESPSDTPDPTFIGRTYGASVDKLMKQLIPHDEAPENEPDK